MKIAITGKGGVGKTTFSSILARLYAEENRSVLAVDVDPDANLGLALGFSEEEISNIKPISEMKELAEERTGSSPDNFGKFFKINPKVDDIPDKFAIETNGVKFLIMGSVDTGGAGCVCPEHVMLKRLISHLVIQNEDVVIMDMEAGLEHLGRGTASNMEQFIVVIEPGSRSIQTYNKVKKLAKDIGVRQVKVVANKVKSKEDEEYISKYIPSEDLLGFIHYNEEVIDADRKGKSPYDFSETVVNEIREIKKRIEQK